MVTLLHGEDTVASRQTLIEMRQTYSDCVFDFSGNDLTEFVRMADGQDFFSPKKLIVIEAAKQALLKDLSYLSYLESKPDTTAVVFWVGEELSPQSELLKVSQRAGWRVKLFNRFNRSYVFNFIDALFDRQRTEALSFLTKLLQSEENLFGIIDLIVYRARVILWSKLGVPSFSKLKPFVRSKVTKQAKLFSEGELVELIETCCQLEQEAKTGVVDPSLGILKVSQLLC